MDSRGAKQVRLTRLIRQVSTDLTALDGPEATATGLLLAASRTRDIVDAHVVLCARRADQVVVTSDPDDLEKIDSSLQLVVV